MKCKKCGKEVSNTDAFCQYCGSKVEEETKEVAVSTAKKEKTEKVKAEKVEAVKVVEPSQGSRSGKGLAIAGMVLGILGLIFSIVIGPIAFILSLLGLIFSLTSKFKSGFRVAGIVTSIIGFVIQIIYVIILVFFSAMFTSLLGVIEDEYESELNNSNNYNYTYKYASVYGEWKCKPYPSYSYTNDEETTLNLKYSGKYVYGPSDSLDSNYYAGTFTYETEYDKNAKYTDREFKKVTAPVTEFVINNVNQSIDNKNLDFEMEFINDYKEAIIMFDNTSNTYLCKK